MVVNISNNIAIEGGQSNVSTSASGANNAGAKQVGSMVTAIVNEALVKATKQGGVLWNMRNGRA